MPSDSNGVYNLPNGYQAVTGKQIQASQHNPPLEDLASAMTQRLMRSGAAPMTGPHKIVDGSVGSPAVQFNNASSTGIYKTTSGFGVAVNGNRVAEFGAGGIVKGARYIGELIPITLSDAPALTVKPYGQNLNRADYPELWAVAQAEIANGHTFYNNGNGSTTFGIGDMRGRGLAAKDDMGGTAAGRVTTAGSGIDGRTIGAAGGAQSQTLTAAQVAAHTHPAVVSDPLHSHGVTGNGNLWSNSAVANVAASGGNFPHYQQHSIGIAAAATGISVAVTANTGGQAHNNVQPTMICNYVLFAGA